MKIKAIIYDSDGMLTHGGRFSEQYAKEFGISERAVASFFKGPFKRCLVGETDLKEELKKVLFNWGWRGTVDELLDYWFSVGDSLDQKVYSSVSKLKSQGVICLLATNQEKYRTEYLVNKFKCNDIFDEVVSSAYIGFSKTSEGGLQKIYEALRAHNEKLLMNEIMFCDDDEKNIEDLKKSGLVPYLYTDFNSFKESLAKNGYFV